MRAMRAIWLYTGVANEMMHLLGPPTESVGDEHNFAFHGTGGQKF